MNQNIFAFALCAMLLSFCAQVTAQQSGRIPRIGFLAAGSSSTPSPSREAFRQGLRDLGYVEDKNILIEVRYAEGKSDRFPDLAAELVRLKVDVIVVASALSASAASKVTTTIPIVMAGSDPLVAGSSIAWHSRAAILQG
jgi:putative ABC transport system substrate-binding protein